MKGSIPARWGVLPGGGHDNAHHGGLLKFVTVTDINGGGIQPSETFRCISGLSSLWLTCGQHFHGSVADLEQRDIVSASPKVKHQHLIGG